MKTSKPVKTTHLNIDEITARAAAANNSPAITSNYQRVSATDTDLYIDFYQIIPDYVADEKVKAILLQRIQITHSNARGLIKIMDDMLPKSTATPPPTPEPD